MASTYSTNLAIELIGTGDQAGSWGNTTNTNLGTLIEQAISGYVTQAVSTGTDTTITIPNGATGVARNMYIELTGTGGTNTNLIVPANKKLYFIFNNTSSGQVTVKVSGQTGVSVPNGKKMVLVSNGTDVVVAENYIADFGSNSATITNLTCTSLTLSNNPTFSGGTANGVLYLNGSKVATSGSGLQFDGTRLFVGTTTTSTSSTQSGEIYSTGAVGFMLTNTTAANFPVSIKNEGSSGTRNLIRFYEGPAGGTARASVSLDGSNYLTFDTNNFIINTGNLGIGTSSPAAKFHTQQAGSAGVVVGAYLAASGNGGSGRGTGLLFGAPGSSSVVDVARIDGLQNTAAATANDAALVFNVANTSGTLTERLRIDSAGNLGLGVTPNSGWADFKVFQNTEAAILGYPGQTHYTQNAYWNGSVWKYIASSSTPASRYTHSSGAHSWFIAGSGTAGNTISFTQAMTLDASGNLGVGTTSPAVRLDVQTASAVGGITLTATTGTNGAALLCSNTGGGSYFGRNNSSGGAFGGAAYATVVYGGGAYPMSFYTNDTERMRLDSSGNLGLGVTPSAWTAYNAFQVKYASFWGDASTFAAVGANYYYGNSAYRYISNGVATDYYQSAGSHVWRTAASGTAGNAITFTEIMSARGDGFTFANGSASHSSFDVNVGVGAASWNYGFIRLGSNNLYCLTWGGGASGYGDTVTIKNPTNNPLVFGTNNTERARITAAGEFLVGTTTANSTTGITLRADGVIVAKGVYNTLVSSNTRDIYMDDSGYFGYISSTRASKTNIVNATDVSWLLALNPVSFNYKKFDRELNAHIDEPIDEVQYGLIAEDVEAVKPELCFYDEVNGKQELRGVSYSKLVTPMLKLIQQQQAAIAALEAKVAALEAK